MLWICDRVCGKRICSHVNWNLWNMWRPTQEAVNLQRSLEFWHFYLWLADFAASIQLLMCVCSTHKNQNWNTALEHLLVLQSLKSRAVAIFYFSESFQDLLHICAFSCLLGRANCGKPVTVTSIPLCIDPMSARTLANALRRILLKCLKMLFVPVWVPCPSSVTCLFPMNSEQWALHLQGWFSWRLGLCLQTVKTQWHVAPLSSTGSITQEGRKDRQETNNIWKCPWEISQSLSAQKPLSCVGKAQIKGHSLL